MTELSRPQAELLSWLAEDDGQYGECHGPVLTSLMEMALVEWATPEHPRGDMFRYVRLTEAGRVEHGQYRLTCTHPYRAADRAGFLRCGVCGSY